MCAVAGLASAIGCISIPYAILCKADAIVDIFQWSMILGGGNSDNEDGNPLGFIGSIAMIILAPLAATLIQMA